MPRDSSTASSASVRWFRILSHSYWSSTTTRGWYKKRTYLHLVFKLRTLLFYALGHLCRKLCMCGILSDLAGAIRNHHSPSAGPKLLQTTNELERPTQARRLSSALMLRRPRWREDIVLPPAVVPSGTVERGRQCAVALLLRAAIETSFGRYMRLEAEKLKNRTDSSMKEVVEEKDTRAV